MGRRALFLLFAVAPILAADRAADIDRLVAAYHQTDKFHGSALVAESGRVVLKKGYGLANREFGIPNDPDTKFRLGSITKQFTAVLVLQLVEEGKLKLDAKISDYLPEYPKKHGARVTIHQLLNHSSGIPSYTDFKDFFAKRSRDPFTPLELTKLFWDMDLEFEPGSKYAYNNSGYHLLGVILEKVAGNSYEKRLDEKILKPLGMKNTGYDHSDAILPKRASGYRMSLDGFLNAQYIDMSIPFAAGGMYSSVEDLYLWDQALYTEKLLSAKSKELMFRPGLNNYGYGWVIDQVTVPGSDEKVPRIAHGGGIPGFATLLTRLPGQRHLIVLLSNTPGAARLGDITTGVIAVLSGREPKFPKVSIQRPIYDAVKAKGVEAAAATYRKLRAEEPERYDFGESELNQLGYALMQEAKRTKDAIEIFKLNVEAHPKSSNVYDSLAEAYMRDGQKELAVTFYEKAIELDPKNANAAAQLKKLKAK
jgi:CubicO group peptidase (beta-lactamase class C family)